MTSVYQESRGAMYCMRLTICAKYVFGFAGDRLSQEKNVLFRKLTLASLMMSVDPDPDKNIKHD